MASLLALDTTAETCSAALWHNEQVVARSTTEPRAHTRLLMPLMHEVLAEAGIPLSGIDAIAFGRGPGSFTGLRITAGAVQGLAWGLDCPVIPVSSLAATAWAAMAQYQVDAVASAFDARMDEVYWGVFRDQSTSSQRPQVTTVIPEQVLAPEQVVLPEEGERWFGAGSGFTLKDRMPSPVQSRLGQIHAQADPLAEPIVRLAIARYEQQDWVSAEDAEPVYVRDKVSWKKLPGR